MENFKVEIDYKSITEKVNQTVNQFIVNSLEKNKNDIQKSIDDYFAHGYFQKKMTTFEGSLDWAIEHACRIGVDEALKELDFSNLIKEKAKEYLSKPEIIAELVEKKVKCSLGIS